MSKIDFAKAKADVREIVEIVGTVPPELQQRCFELLFEAAFNSNERTPTSSEGKLPQKPGDGTIAETSKSAPSEKKLPSNVLAFARRQNITAEELGKLFMLDHDPLLPVYKIPQGSLAKSQLLKVMMVLLENGLLNNSLSASYSELRDSVKDDGFLDQNFPRMLRNNHTLFRGAVSEKSIDENGSIELSSAGMEKLAEIIRELGK